MQVFGNAPMLGIVVAMETFCGQVGLFASD